MFIFLMTIKHNNKNKNKRYVKKNTCSLKI